MKKILIALIVALSISVILYLLGFLPILFLILTIGLTIALIFVVRKIMLEGKNSPREEEINNDNFTVITVCLCIGIFILLLMPSCLKSGGGDGITTCKNCGKSEVVLFGYCSRCADGFLDFVGDKNITCEFCQKN